MLVNHIGIASDASHMGCITCYAVQYILDIYYLIRNYPANGYHIGDDMQITELWVFKFSSEAERDAMRRTLETFLNTLLSPPDSHGDYYGGYYASIFRMSVRNISESICLASEEYRWLLKMKIFISVGPSDNNSCETRAHHVVGNLRKFLNEVTGLLGDNVEIFD